MADNDRLQALIAADPVAALKLIQSLQGNVFYPHPGQVPVMQATERFMVLNCGRRWGKTKVGVARCMRVVRQPDKMVWWVAPTYKVVKRGYREALRQLPKGMLTHDPPPETYFDAGRSVVWRFKNGTRFEFYSAERPGGMLGEGVDFAVLDEAATMPPTIWSQIVRPTLIDRQGSAMMISTPRGQNWFWRAWMKGQSADSPEWASWTFTTYDNPTLPPGEVDQMKADLDRLTFEQEGLAKFLAAGSSVFLLPPATIQTSAVYENGMVEGVTPEGQVIFGIDLAKTTDYTVIYGANSSNRRNCYFKSFNEVSWGEQKRLIARAVKQVRRAGASDVTLVMDSTGVGDPIVEDVEAAGYDVIPINFTTHKQNMVRRLAKDLEDAKAFVLEEGKREEFDTYAMSMTPTGKFSYGAPAGEHDDAVSAKMLQHHGLVDVGTPGVTALSAEEELDAPDDEFGEIDEEWADLVDDGVPEDEAAAYAMGLTERGQRSVADLLNDPNVWERR